MPSAAGREAIVKATRDVVIRVGFRDMTVADICQEAGVVRATFYVYFANKLDAFMGMIRHVLDSVYDVAGQHYPDEDEYSRIVLANLAFLRVWGAERHVLTQWFALALVDDEAGALYSEYRRRFEDRIEGRMRVLIDTGRVPETDARLMTVALSGMVETFTRRLYGPDNLGEPDELLPSALRVISEAWYRMLYAKNPPEHDYDRHFRANPGVR